MIRSIKWFGIQGVGCTMRYLHQSRDCSTRWVGIRCNICGGHPDTRSSTNLHTQRILQVRTRRAYVRARMTSTISKRYQFIPRLFLRFIVVVRRRRQRPRFGVYPNPLPARAYRRHGVFVRFYFVITCHVSRHSSTMTVGGSKFKATRAMGVFVNYTSPP